MVSSEIYDLATKVAIDTYSKYYSPEQLAGLSKDYMYFQQYENAEIYAIASFILDNLYFHEIEQKDLADISDFSMGISFLAKITQ
ncbi:hypothetical protein [Sulfolobus sp. E11-6]|uniref:hypothetical protein n=1 Tax=Sulfolobus sp. E11-6 TaxID=2663020 RepID=UPI001297A765|nr:hypothetical protein [Sulfolobus sp. E11-6]QGA68911.1 hypothetical protein GFS33_09440 [Sulfolobus sp. E11-6]